MAFRLSLVFIALVVVGVSVPAQAQIRQHVLADLAPDPEEVLSEMSTSLTEQGFQVSLSRDEKQNAALTSGSVSVRYVEYSIWRPSDGRNVQLVMLLIDSKEQITDLAEVATYYTQTYGMYAPSGLLTLRGLGVVAWNEWSSVTGTNTTETLDNELADWRDRYIEQD